MIIFHCGDCFQCHVAGALDGPFVVLFDEDRADDALMAASLGKMPTTFVRRLISPLTRSISFVECNFTRCCCGKRPVSALT
jgi:hypothetical protein